MHAGLIDRTGEIHGKLRILKRGVDTPSGKPRWTCQCDCGVIKDVYYYSMTKKTRPQLSCGCIHREVITKHGYCTRNRRSGTYQSWECMRQRCNNSNHKHYHRYGGRGIKVCDRWNDFSHFLSDMGERPENLTLDRIEPDMGYSPENCRWATNKRQAYNKMIKWDGIELSPSKWARKLGIPRILLYRIARAIS